MIEPTHSRPRRSHVEHSVEKVPAVTGIWNSLLNFGELYRFPTQFHAIRHMMNYAEGKTTNRAQIWDVAKAIYEFAKGILFDPKRYVDEESLDCELVDLSDPFFRPCPVMDFDFYILIKSLYVTGVFDTQMIRQILRANRQHKRETFQVSPTYQGIGMLTDPGRTPFTAMDMDYDELRRFFRYHLNTKNITSQEGLADQLHDLVQEVIRNFHEAEEGEVQDVSKITFSLPSKVIQCMLFGHVIPELKDRMWEMLLLIRRIVSTIASESRAQAIKKSDNYLCLKELMQKVWDNPSEYPGLLSQMAMEMDGDGKNQFSREDLFATLIFFLSAGEDTLSSAITSTFYVLGFNQDIQDSLYETLRPYYEESEVVDLTVLDRIPKLDHVVKEILRLYPALPILNRNVNPERPKKKCPVLLSGPEGRSYPLNEDRMLWLYVHEAQRDSAYWKNPESFIPERWEESHMEEYLTDTRHYLAFGIGPNRCLGESLARIELKALIYYILKTFRFETTREVFFCPKIALSPENPVSIQVKTRKSRSKIR